MDLVTWIDMGTWCYNNIWTIFVLITFSHGWGLLFRNMWCSCMKHQNLMFDADVWTSKYDVWYHVGIKFSKKKFFCIFCVFWERCFIKLTSFPIPVFNWFITHKKQSCNTQPKHWPFWAGKFRASRRPPGASIGAWEYWQVWRRSRQDNNYGQFGRCLDYGHDYVGRGTGLFSGQRLAILPRCHYAVYAD